MATKAVAHYAISIRLACQVFKVSEGCYRYQPVLADENQEIADWLLRLTANQRNWGFGLCFLYLRNVKGFGWMEPQAGLPYLSGARCDLSVGCSLGAFPENWRRQPNQSPEVPQ